MAARRPSAFVHGAAVHRSWADARLNLSELIYGGVSAALAEARIPITEVDSVVMAAHDVVDGRSLSSMVTAPAAGAYLRDEIRLAEDGLAAASLGAARIEAGESRLTLVAAWGRASEGEYLQGARALYDPFFEQPVGVNEFDVSAMRLSAWMARHGQAREGRARAAEARAKRAAENPRSLKVESRRFAVNCPLSDSDAPKPSDIVVALVLSSTESAVRVAGCGHSSEASAPGDRDFLQMRALREAASRALNKVSARDVGVWEIGAGVLSDEAIALETLGVAQSGRGFDAYVNDGRVNASGGGAAGWCYPAAGLAALAETFFRLTEKPSRGVAIGVSPRGVQVAHAMLLEAA